MSLLERYRKQWPRVGGALAMAVGGAVALAAGKTSKSRTLSAANFGALLVHQYEEYEDPGYFPGQFNRGMFKSNEPDRYPLNTQSTLCVNTVFAYPFYLLPILFPKQKWLGLAPAVFGMTQAVGHGVIIPRAAGDTYSPGFLASILLHVPIGLRYLQSIGPIGRGDWAKGLAYMAGFTLVGVVGPNVVYRDHDSPYRFRADLVGRYGVED